MVLKTNIYIQSKQIYETEVEEIKQCHKGTMLMNYATVAFMQYDEEENGAKIENFIRIDVTDPTKKQIWIRKQGAIQARIKFNQNEPSNATYQTPAGEIQFDIKVKELSVQLGEKIQFRIDYELFNYNEKLSDHLFILESEPILQDKG